MTRTNSMKLVPLLMTLLLWLMIGYCHGQSKDANTYPAKSLRVVLPVKPGRVMQHIAAVFATRVEERCGARVSTAVNGEITVELVITPGIGTEGFSITSNNGIIRISGNDERGVLYGVGKFLRTSVYSKEGFTAGKWRGTSVPEKPIRGIYLATHFYNYYQNAPVEEVERYIEDLSLWGINNLLFFYDMHHFKGPADPDAVTLHKRLKRFMQAAKKLGIGTGFMVIGNEGYANSPVELRAVPGGSRGGNYPEDICPNKPGGLEYTLKILGQHFDWSRDLQPDYVCIWPYDQGGCGSADCQPWGSGGFIKCARAIAKMARIKLPGVKVILSTWYFDSTEWHNLSKQVEKDNSWFDMMMAESPEFAKGSFPPMPGNIPTLGFPEISMDGSFPWGGFGATALPNRLSSQWKAVHNKLSGGFPYSEGIYEDINKTTYAQLYWNPEMPIEEILKEYMAFEYNTGEKDTNEMLKVIAILEQNHHMRWWPGELEGVKLTLDWFPSKNIAPQPDPGAEEAYAIVKRVDNIIPERTRKSWRWRLLYIRTMLDAELKANGGAPNNLCIKGFEELLKIYHTTHKTDPAVKPPITIPAD